MTTEVLLLALLLPLHVVLSVIWRQFRHVIKMITDVEITLNKHEFFTDTADKNV